MAALSSLYGSNNRLKNVFIVEFAPRQASEEVSEGVSFGEFILDLFNVYNVGSWGWFTRAQQIFSVDDLNSVELGNGGSNTDLILLPKGIRIEDIIN